MAPASLLRSTVLWRSLAVVLLLAGLAGAVIAFVGWRANAILTQAGERAITSDAQDLRAELAAQGFEGLVAAVADRSRLSGPALYFLADASGQRRAGNLAELPRWDDGQGRGIFRYRPLGATSGDRAAAGILIEIDDRAHLVVARDVEDQRALLVAIYRSIGTGAGLLLLIGVAGSLLISRHVLARIDAMSAASAVIMAGDLSRRIPVAGSGDELDRLALRLNEMLSRIEQLMAGLREVSDNISHDLKTPLNRLRNRAEAALADGRGGEAWRTGLERVIEEADELIKTFNALLLIARLEAGSGPHGQELVALDRLVADVAELYEPLAEEQGVGLSVSTQPDLVVRANRQLIGQALANLIENALKYGTPGAGRPAVTIRAERSGEEARLVVADRGAGIAASDRERALRRFVRLEQSRSQPGTGLGLSLVAAVVRLHEGRLALEDNAPGLRVVMHLPLALGGAGMAGWAATAREDAKAATG